MLSAISSSLCGPLISKTCSKSNRNRSNSLATVLQHAGGYPRCCGRISCWPQAVGRCLLACTLTPRLAPPLPRPALPRPRASPSPALWSPSGVLLNAAPSSRSPPPACAHPSPCSLTAPAPQGPLPRPIASSSPAVVSERRSPERCALLFSAPHSHIYTCGESTRERARPKSGHGIPSFKSSRGQLVTTL